MKDVMDVGNDNLKTNDGDVVAEETDLLLEYYRQKLKV